MSYYFNKVFTDKSFEEAIDDVTDQLKVEGFGILTNIDMKSTLKEKIGVDFKRYTILGACNPNYAHTALQKEDKIGAFLPCNVIVEEQENGATGEHYLIDAEEIEYGIGDWSADSVTKVIFNWGVSLDANHANPGQYLSTHPLAPQYPTMHWGWNAGYRFIRADGTFDDNGDGTPNLIFQYHMVGDQFVKKISVDAHSMINADDELEVWITGYYERLFNEINLSMFPSVHGSTTPIPNLWVNITTEPVFGIFDGRMEVPVDTTDTSTGINPVENLNSLSIYPNPSIDGYVKVSLVQPLSSEVQFDLVDLSGRIQDSYRTTNQGFVEFTDLAKGFYIVKATDEFGDIIAVSKVQVQ